MEMLCYMGDRQRQNRGLRAVTAPGESRQAIVLVPELSLTPQMIEGLLRA